MGKRRAQQPKVVEPPTGVPPSLVFLVPLGPKEGRMRYEAVFN